MRRLDWRLIAGVAIVGVICIVWLLATGGLIWSTLDDGARAMVRETLAPQLALLIFMWAISLLAVAVALNWLVRYYLTAPARLAEQAQVLLGTDIKRRLEPTGSPENRQLTALLNQLVEQREVLRAEMVGRVQEAARNTELEKNRLAALMSELSKSVVVCNLEGRILLYNHSARHLFRTMAAVPDAAGGAEIIGLGRSIYTVFDRHVVEHALDKLKLRLARGVTAPSSQFVTGTEFGKLLRVQMAPVRATDSRNTINGFVLLIENITNELESQSRQDHVLTALTERSRAALASMQAALDVLAYPDIEVEMRERMLGVLREETSGLGQHINGLKTTVDGLLSSWPLEEMLGADLVAAAVRRIQSLQNLEAGEAEIDDSLWLRVDSFAVLQALCSLAELLHSKCDVTHVRMALQASGSRARLALCWKPSGESLDFMQSWEQAPLEVQGETSALTVQAVMDRHGGTAWLEREEGEARFCMLLPTTLAPEQSGLELQGESRPEYYDFDLFQASEQSRSLEDCPLRELSYTVFDTETTGLDPAAGDEIIQIGAVRIVNGKLLPQETFDQLVDPGRSIPKHTISIHGISPDMVKGQPTAETVIPAFHRFVGDTVLVAHNAAFDMRCLQVKEEATGVVFDQAVLDTLLLSAAVHPNQESHGLEELSERFDVRIAGRHTALGDALATAEIFRHLIPLLQERGIYTLGQARDLAQKTYYARMKY